MHSLSDTLNTVGISSKAILPGEYLGLIGVVLGVLISILGSWLLAKRQADLQIKNSLFLRRLDTYLKFMELIWPGGVRKLWKGRTLENSILTPYASNKDLSKWLYDLTDFVSKNSLIIDNNTLKLFAELNAKVLEDLDTIASNTPKEDLDNKTIDVGLQSAKIVSRLCFDIHNSAWDYFKKEYNVTL